MEITFIRHGEPDWTGDESTLHDPPLTQRGTRQAELAADRIAAESGVPTDLVASPALRAQETVRPLADRTGLFVQTVDDLLELGMPSRAGLTEEEGQRLQDDSFNRLPPQWWDGLDGGETFARFHKRVTRALEGILGERGVRPDEDHERLWTVDDPDRRIVIVAHGGTIAVSIGALIGAAPAPWEWRRFTSHHASITRLHTMEFAGRHVWAMRVFNDLEHLPVDLRTRKRYLP
jgi:probable phosphoglycerate mutase